jgi:hypothetical protein
LRAFIVPLRYLLEVLLEPHAVENADDMDVSVGTNEVHDPIVTPEENAQVTTPRHFGGRGPPAETAPGSGPAGRWT